MANINIEITICVFFGLVGIVVSLQHAMFELEQTDSAVDGSEECFAQEHATSTIECSLKGINYQDKATLLQIEQLSDSQFICSFFSGAITKEKIIKKPGTNLYSFLIEANKSKKVEEEKIAVNNNTLSNITRDGIYNITINGTTIEVLVESRENSEWIVIQNRFDGSVNFHRNWEEYKNGFGTLHGEFWIGNELIHQMTKHQTKETLIRLEGDHRNVGETIFVVFSGFSVGSEESNYEVNKGSYVNGGNTFTFKNSRHIGLKTAWELSGNQFITLDKHNCSVTDGDFQNYFEGWWRDLQCKHGIYYINFNSRIA